MGPVSTWESFRLFYFLNSYGQEAANATIIVIIDIVRIQCIVQLQLETVTCLRSAGVALSFEDYHVEGLAIHVVSPSP